MKKKHTKNKIPGNKGFSLVELVVVISIFAIMTTISSLDYNEHKSGIERSSLAQDIALSVRQAQVYGISASAKNIGDISFDGTYADEYFDNQTGIVDVTQDKSIRGVSFDLGSNSMILFEDNYKNYVYNGENDRIIDQRDILSKSISFDYFYLCNSDTCVEKDTGFLDIVFQRPYPDSIINYRTSRSLGASVTPYQYAAIVLSDGTAGENEYVEVYSIGNIVVKSNHEI